MAAFCRISGALPDVRGVAGCPPVSPCGVAVCTVALPGGRGVAGWRGALPDNSPLPIPKLDLESGIRVLGQGRSYNVTCLFKLRDVSIFKTEGHETVSVKNANSVTLSQPQISECCELRFRKPEPTEVSCHAARMYLVRRVRRRRSAWSYLTSREARLDREVDPLLRSRGPAGTVRPCSPRRRISVSCHRRGRRRRRACRRRVRLLWSHCALVWDTC